uniref:Cupin-like domain-containing protein n=1 Tax=Auxenochlorella protothecoides TaxID=3075 RepID=A0A1D1ZXM2_AUXPR
MGAAGVPSSKGPGRTRPRQHQKPAADLRLPAISHEDAEYGEVAGDPTSRVSPSIEQTWCTYIEPKSLQAWYAAFRLVAEQQAALLKGSPLLSGALPDLDDLASWVTSETSFSVYSLGTSPGRLLVCDAEKNIYGSHYHIREPESSTIKLTAAEFVQCARKWKSKLLVLEALYPLASIKPSTERTSLRRNLPSGLQTLVDWDWLEAWLAAQEFGPLSSLRLMAGVRGTLLPASYAVRDRILTQLTGRSRVFLFPPSMAFQGLYPYPVHHGYDKYSMVNLEEPDVAEWPLATRLKAVKAVLHPGDALFIPNYWFAHVEMLAPEDLMLTLELGQGARGLTPGAAAVHLSRALEERICEAESPKAVREWLLRIAAGMEIEGVDLATVKGYKRIVLCQGVRDDVEAVLGQGAWSTFLPSMCEGRLQPTPWLNKNFREPLYLTDVPVRLEDDRTEEEKKYPELFRHRLRAGGWTVPENKCTIPIPGYNVPASYQPQSQQA